MKNYFRFLAGVSTLFLLLGPLAGHSLIWATESSTGTAEEGSGQQGGGDAEAASGSTRDANTAPTDGQSGTFKPKTKAKLNTLWNKLGADKDKDAPAPASTR